MAGVGRGRRRETGSGWREDARGTLGPLALMLAGVALGVVQWRLDGGPPTPSGAHIREVLSGTVLADSDVIATAAAAAIAIAALVVGCVALRVALSLIAGDGVTADRADPGDGDGGGAVAPAIGPERPRRVEVVAVRRDAPARRAAGSDAPRLAPPAWSPDGALAPAGVTVGGRSDRAATGMTGDRAFDIEGPTEEIAVPGPAGGGDVAGRQPAPAGRDAAVNAPDEPGSAGAPARTPGEPTGIRAAGDSRAVRSAVPRVPPGATQFPAGTERTTPEATRQASFFTGEPQGDPTDTAQTTEPPFHVQCLGPFRVRARGAAVDRWPLRKSRELLAFLVAHHPVAVRREVIAEALWEGYDWDASLRHTLSNAATTLRTTLRTAAVAAPDELQPLVAARRQLQLPPALFALDVDAFDAALRHAAGLPDPEALGEYERALGLYAGEFLEGEGFTWLDSHRIKHRQRLWDAARTAAAIAERMGDPARAEPLHRTVLKQEPTDEDAARGLMRCLARSGDVAGVRETFTALSEAWVRELDDDTARPSPPTRALFTELVGATAHG